MVYVLILVEAGALFFALWRQKELKRTFSLPAGFKKDQILKPVLFAAILAILIMMMNYLVFTVFDYPETENRRIIGTLLDSAFGIVFVVIVAPLVEELTFRGVLLRFFVDRKRLFKYGIGFDGSAGDYPDAAGIHRRMSQLPTKI